MAFYKGYWCIANMGGGRGAVGSIFKFARDRKVDFTGPVYLYTRQANKRAHNPDRFLHIRAPTRCSRVCAREFHRE